MTKIENAQALLSKWQTLQQEEPNVRIRDGAARLGVGEGEIVAAKIGQGVRRLNFDAKTLFEGMPAVGRVMVLTRNETAVHERKGVFGHVNIGNAHGFVLNETIDLRLFHNVWRHAFLIEEEVHGRMRTSLQFFNKSGLAMHKIYLQEDSDRAAFDALINPMVSEDQTPGIVASAQARDPKVLADSEIDSDALLDAWSGLTDVHQFHGMLRSFSVERQQALRLAQGRFVEPVATDGLKAVLNSASETGLPIMVFVRNRGCIQIHTGPVSSIKEMGDWLNVLDPDFNLHVRTERLQNAYIVRKPTVDGIVTSYELFDVDGDVALTLFGARKPGEKELDGWRDLTGSLIETSKAA